MITAPRLILEPLEPDHAGVLFSGLSDERLYEFIDAEPPESVEALRSRYERLVVGHSPNGQEIWRNWAIRVRDGGHYIGFVQATIFEDRSAAIAYVLFRDFWGRGYGPGAVLAMMNHLRDTDAVTTFRATVDPRNLRSIALLESLGFTRTECRMNSVTLRGIPADESEYVLTELKRQN